LPLLKFQPSYVAFSHRRTSLQ